MREVNEELFDSEPPPSPPQQALVQKAEDEATRILGDTDVMEPERIKMLLTKRVTDRANVEEWVYRFKRDSTAFLIEFSIIILKLERGLLVDNTENIQDLLYAIGALKQFEQNNPVQDSTDAKALHL